MDYSMKYKKECQKDKVRPVTKGQITKGLSESEKKVLVSQSCLTLCHPMDCSPPGSSAHGIFQARILEWVATAFSRGSSQPRDRTSISYVSCIGKQVLYH